MVKGDKRMSEGVTAQPANRYFTFEGLKLHYAEWGDRVRDTILETIFRR